MNKRLISSLLGGGVTAVIASLGGIKLSDTIDYNKKVSRYRTIGNQFNQAVEKDRMLKGWYFPRWEDDEIWKKQHDRSANLSSIKVKYPTPHSFRDYCFEKAEKDKSLKECINSEGWCTECGREKSWDGK